MPDIAQALHCLENWYAGLKPFKDSLPSRGSIGAALVVLDRLKSSYDLGIDAHVTKDGNSQIVGLSATSVARILAQFGETRPLSAVGGRSNRGARGDIARLLAQLEELNIEALEPAERNQLLDAMQRHAVKEYVAKYFSVKRVKASFDNTAATRNLIGRILADAKASGKAGCVAQHLVGAKLALLCGDERVGNERCTAADEQTNRRGDFQLGNTVFHVTVAPMPELFTKCRGIAEDGYRQWLLVTDSHVFGARQSADAIAPDKIAVESIESFIATNLDEFVEFDGDVLVTGFRRLLDKYNQRVDAVEIDSSLQIDITPNI